MALKKEQKKKIVEQLEENIGGQKAMVFAAIEGLKANELFVLRKKLKETNCLLRVAKKTLLSIVFKKKKIDFESRKLSGQLALIFGFEDEISPAKTAYQFSLTNEKLKILGGFLEGKFRPAEEIIALAKIPSRQELLARVVSNIFSPASSFVNVLQGNIKGLICVLSNIKPQGPSPNAQ